jgi:hypothetical protein
LLLKRFSLASSATSNLLTTKSNLPQPKISSAFATSLPPYFTYPDGAEGA